MCSVRILMESNVFKGYEYSDIVLRPETKRFKSTKTEGWLDMIEEGYREAINNMPAILRLFQRNALNIFKKKKLQLKFEKPVIE